MNVCRWAARRTARAANGAVLHQSGSVLPVLLQRGGQLPRPLHSGSASDLRTPLLHDGAVWPVPVLSKREASALREQLLAETSGVLQAGFLGSDLLYYKAHLIFSVVDTLARHPAVVSAVQRALGSEDVLLWDASIPLKPPTSSDAGADENASTFFPWHQDATYFGLTPADGVVTCWIALSDASEAHGCMRVIRGSHTAGQLEHALKPGESGSMLRRGQQVEDVSASAGEVMALGAGEMSIHNPFTLHCSGPNTTQEARVGVVLNFLPPSTIPNNSVGSATLIAGQCDYDHWHLSSWRPDPRAGAGATTDSVALQAHVEALSLHRGELQANPGGVDVA